MVTVYGQPACNPCMQTKKFLDKNDIEYDYRDIASDATAFDELTKLGYKSTPVIVAPSGEHWAGFDLNKMKNLSGGE